MFSIFLPPLAAVAVINLCSVLFGTTYAANKAENENEDPATQEEKYENAEKTVVIDKSLPYWELGTLPRKPKQTYCTNIPSDVMRDQRLDFCITRSNHWENERLLVGYNPTDNGYSSADEDWEPSARKLEAAFEYASKVGATDCNGGSGDSCICVLENIRENVHYFLSSDEESDSESGSISESDAEEEMLSDSESDFEDDD